MTKKAGPFSIDELKKFLTEQPDKARILREDEKGVSENEALRSAVVKQRNAEIRARRNIKE